MAELPNSDRDAIAQALLAQTPTTAGNFSFNPGSHSALYTDPSSGAVYGQGTPNFANAFNSAMGMTPDLGGEIDPTHPLATALMSQTPAAAGNFYFDPRSQAALYKDPSSGAAYSPTQRQFNDAFWSDSGGAYDPGTSPDSPLSQAPIFGNQVVAPTAPPPGTRGNVVVSAPPQGTQPGAPPPGNVEIGELQITPNLPARGPVPAPANPTTPPVAPLELGPVPSQAPPPGGRGGRGITVTDVPTFSNPAFGGRGQPLPPLAAINPGNIAPPAGPFSNPSAPGEQLSIGPNNPSSPTTGGFNPPPSNPALQGNLGNQPILGGRNAIIGGERAGGINTFIRGFNITAPQVGTSRSVQPGIPGSRFDQRSFPNLPFSSPGVGTGGGNSGGGFGDPGDLSGTSFGDSPGGVGGGAVGGGAVGGGAVGGGAVGGGAVGGGAVGGGAVGGGAVGGGAVGGGSVAGGSVAGGGVSGGPAGGGSAPAGASGPAGTSSATAGGTTTSAPTTGIDEEVSIGEVEIESPEEAAPPGPQSNLSDLEANASAVPASATPESATPESVGPEAEFGGWGEFGDPGGYGGYGGYGDAPGGYGGYGDFGGYGGYGGYGDFGGYGDAPGGYGGYGDLGGYGDAPGGYGGYGDFGGYGDLGGYGDDPGGYGGYGDDPGGYGDDPGGYGDEGAGEGEGGEGDGGEGGGGGDGDGDD